MWTRLAVAVALVALVAVAVPLYFAGSADRDERNQRRDDGEAGPHRIPRRRTPANGW